MLKGPDLVTTQAHNKGFELARHIIYVIYDWWENMEDLMLWNHNHRLSIAVRNCMISERSFSEDPVLMMVCLKPEFLSLTSNTIYNKHLQVKLFGKKSVLHDKKSRIQCHQNK